MEVKAITEVCENVLFECNQSNQSIDQSINKPTKLRNNQLTDLYYVIIIDTYTVMIQ
jgi:hypothetical protein